MDRSESSGAAPSVRGTEGSLPASAAIIGKLVDLAPDSILVTDPHGLITDINARTEQMFGYKREELLGQTVDVLVPQRFRGTHPAHRLSYSHNPRSRPMGAGLQLFGQRKDGSEFPVDIMLSPVETAQGRMVLSVVRDITEQKRAQEALRRTEQQLLSLVENVRDHAIFLLDADGIVQTWNAGAERIKGYKASEIIGQHISKFYASEDRERKRPQESLSIAASRGRYEAEGWRVRKDGSRFWANVVITALKEKDGRVSGYAKVTRDFTERKSAEEALLLELSKAMLAQNNIRKLLAVVSDSVQHVVPHDSANLAIYDAGANVLRVQFLEFGEKVEEIALPVEGSAAGRAFTTQEPLVLDEIPAAGFLPETFRHHVARNLKSACWLPLMNREKAVGVMMVASRQKAAYGNREVEALTHIAAQIAAAVDNVVAFKQIAELTDRLKETNRYLEDELNTEHRFDEIVGDTPELKRALKQLETVAPTDATVLIQGETGTGKELIARAIHRLSSRHDRTFVKLNCAAIPSGLLESELFGHEKGAFTGAISQKVGRLELAHEGTLFLDEVGDIPLELQPKLLRALQEKEFERLGSTRTIHVNVRLVAATNRDLAAMVLAKQFRSDLYYRLKVFPLAIPSLRERRDDIQALINYFVDKHARNLGKHIETVPSEVMKALEGWHWPGNIRELENFLERAVILTKGKELYAPLAELRVEAAEEEDEDATLEGAEREHIINTLRETRGIIAGEHGAAARLGLKRTTLNAKLKKLGIDPEEYR